jgi:hypothetical protein
MLRKSSLLIALAVGFVSPATTWAQSASPVAARAGQGAASAFQEKLIGEMTPGSSFKDMRIGGDHIAWVEDSAGKRTVRLDGNPQGGAFDDVKYMKFNGDATHLVFFGKHGSSWVFVLDGHEQPQAYDKFSGVSFQPGGTSYAFVACQEKKCRLNVDGVESGAVYENFSYAQYSRDGNRLAYLVKRGEKWIAVVDGKEMATDLDELWGSAWGFTQDGKRFYAAGRLNGKWVYVVDGVPGPGFDAISRIAFSPDNQHFAYGGAIVKGGALKKKTIGTMVMDGKSGETYEGSGMAGSLSLIGGAWQYMIGGVHDLVPDFHGVSTPRFNSAGKLAYAVRRKKDDVAVLVGGEAGPGFEEILSPVAFSLDAAHFVYIAKRGGEFLEVRDHQVRQTFALSKTKNRTTGVPWMQMSGDGTHLAYEIVSGGEQFQQGNTGRALRSIVLDGKAGPEYDVLELENFDCAKDASHFHYEVRGAKGDRDLVNVDGHESRLYDSVWATGFSDDGEKVIFIARDDKRFLRVSYPLQ